MKIDAVFEGGGVRGIGLVGAVCCVEDNGYKIERFAGTSAGAIVASLLAVGYTGKEIKDIMLAWDFNNFLYDGRVKQHLAIAKYISLFKYKGIYSGDAIEEFVRNLLIKKRKTKFKDISVNGESKLKIIASDISRKEMIILPDDIKKYGINPMEFDIAKAVRMSVSIPFYFKPVKVSYKGSYSFIVDGGILSNFPIWIFDVEESPRWPTFGFRFINKKPSYIPSNKNNFITYLFDVVSTMLDKNEEVYIRHKDSVRTIFIPTLGVNVTDFDINNEMKLKLFNSGYKIAKEFLNKWDFNYYKQVYKPSKKIII